MSRPARGLIVTLLGGRPGLAATSLLLMVATPYLGSLPVRAIPHVMALSQGASPRSAELELLLGDAAGRLGPVLVAMLLAGALSFALALLQTRVSAALTSNVVCDLRLLLHGRLLDRPPWALREGNLAALARTGILDQSRVVALYVTNTVPAALGVLVGTLVWAQTLWGAIDAPGQRSAAALVLVAVIGVLLVVNLSAVWLAGRMGERSQRQVVQAQASFAGLVGESVEHVAELQLHTATDEQQRRMARLLDGMARSEVRVATWSGLATAATGGVVLLGIPLLVVAWRALGLQGDSLAVMVPALLMLQRTIASAGSLWTSRKVSQPALDLVGRLLEREPTVADAPGARELRAATGRVQFESVEWAARGRPVLRGVTLDVAPGETVALVGEGGCGKSTLLNLVVRLVHADAGHVLLDGLDVREVKLADLRRRVALLEQHPAFFARSLRENLLLDGSRVADSRILEAARTANALETIERRGGLDHVLADASKTLSGSERRRLALARLLLREPDVVLLDEPEAGLPQALAQQILAELRQATRGRTCLMVTHRPDLLAADRVAFLHEGRILAIGTHEELERGCAPYRGLLAQKRRPDDELAAIDGARGA